MSNEIIDKQKLKEVLDEIVQVISYLPDSNHFQLKEILKMLKDL